MKEDNANNMMKRSGCLQKTCFGALLTVVAFLGMGFQGFAQNTRDHGLSLKRTAPGFTLKTPVGDDLTLSSLRGQIVLVDFWASWCMPCRALIPHLKEVYSKYHSSGLQIVSVSADANPVAWKKAMEQEQMPWIQVIDTFSDPHGLSDVATSYGVQSIPFLLLLDKEGRIIAINPDPEKVDRKLKKIFGKQGS